MRLNEKMFQTSQSILLENENFLLGVIQLYGIQTGQFDDVHLQLQVPCVISAGLDPKSDEVHLQLVYCILLIFMHSPSLCSTYCVYAKSTITC